MENGGWKGQSGQRFSRECVISGQVHYIWRNFLVCWQVIRIVLAGHLE